jgi:hypothetical protein
MSGYTINQYTTQPFSHYKIKLLIRPSFINLPHQAPVTKGAFYHFNHPQSAQSAIQYLAPSPASTADIEPLCLPK